MLGTSTTLETAVGSRPKLNTISTSTTNTAADRIPVRERNSTSRSLDATIRMVVQSQPCQEVARRRHIVERCPEPEVLAYRQLSVELRLVPDPADDAAAAFNVRATTLRLNETGENLEEGRLACAVRTEHGEGLAGLNAEGYIVESPDSTKAVLQALSPQHRSRRRARSIRTV